MQKGILILLISFITVSVYSQKIEEADVPPDVISQFNRKYARAQEVIWDTIHKINYVADFFMDNVQIKAEFTPTGEWIESKEIMDPKSLFRPIENFIEQEFPGSKFTYGEQVIKADKNNYYYVQIEEKIKGIKDIPPTELFFDKTGRFEKVIKPEIPEDPSEVYVEEVDVYEDDFDKAVDNDIKANKKDKKKKKDKDLEEDSGVYERQEVDPRSLPTPIIDYVMNNFDKMIEFKISSAEYLEDEEFGLHYHLIVAREGLNQPESDLYFSVTGKFLKRNDPPEMQEELEQLKEKAALAKEEKEKEVAKENEKEVVKEEAKEEETRERTKTSYAEEVETPVMSVDVPQAVTSYFSRRFPTAEEVVWEEYGNKNYMASFWYRDVRTKTEFTPEGELVSTITEMDPKNIYAPVARYLEENYPDYKVDIGEKAVRKDRNNYYYVLIYTTKKKVTPKEIELYFDKIGRYMEEPPAFLDK